MFKLLLLLLVMTAAPSYAESEVYSRVVQKHIKKVQDRWALEDLYLKKRFSRKKRWSPWRHPMLEMLVDFNFGRGQLYKDEVTGEEAKTASLGRQVQFHFGALGFGVAQDEARSDSSGFIVKRDDLNLYYRLLGPSTQSTHLTMVLGYQGGRHTDYGDIHQPYYGMLANFYLFRHLGLEGLYKVRSQAQNSLYEISGMNYHWGMFWEFSILRLYLNFQQDYHSGKNHTTREDIKQRNSTTVFGARLAF